MDKKEVDCIVIHNPEVKTNQGGLNTSFSPYLSSGANLCRKFSGFKLKIVKHTPSAEQLVNGENIPNKMALAEGYGQAWDLWSEEKDRNRRMKDGGIY